MLPESCWHPDVGVGVDFLPLQHFYPRESLLYSPRRPIVTLSADGDSFEFFLPGRLEMALLRGLPSCFQNDGPSFCLL
jgi:hypothetical protein